MLNLPVADIMNDHPIKVRPDVSIRNTAHLLLRYRINGVLVVDPQSPEGLLGIFTTEDLMYIIGDVMDKGGQKIQALNVVAERPVSEFIDPVYPSLQKDDSALKALALLHKKGAVTIPVFDGKILVGVVGRHDIFNIALA